ncbi:MAG: hypothetical protein IJ629_06625 [Clostridia bacterium]|nr:hypothetical protein [Clostridia bacterium]
MKKKIFNISFLLILTIALLFSLTACGEEEDDDDRKSSKTNTSSAESVIEAAVDAINDQKVNDLIYLIDLDALEASFGEEIQKKWLKEGLQDFFDEYEDLELEVSKIKSLEDDKDVLDDLLDYYDSYEEYVEEVEEDYDLKNVSIYTAKVQISDDYEYLIEDDGSPFEGKDVIYLTKKDGEYKIIFTRLAVRAYADYMYDYDYDDDYDYDYDYDDDDYDYDYDYDDDDYSYNYDSSTEVSMFNAAYESYDGKQLGTSVVTLIDKVIANNTINNDDHPIYISYYGDDGSIEEIMLSDVKDLGAFKSKIATKHYYQVELDEDYQGYIRYIDITY